LTGRNGHIKQKSTISEEQEHMVIISGIKSLVLRDRQAPRVIDISKAINLN
jgi:hypothetical protein